MRTKKDELKPKKTLKLKKEELEKKFLEKMGFVQTMFDFYTSQVI